VTGVQTCALPIWTDEFASQFVASAFVGGDLSQLFELPGGPVAFALGAENRKEKASVDYDALTSSGATFLNALQDFNPPQFVVKEAYAEVQVPLLRDVSFAKELSLNFAGRVSDYNTRTGTVYAYNVQGIYAPIEDLRFRAAYATSVRAPTQGDLFSPASENFAQISDPCDLVSPGSTTAANCVAAGVPTTANAALVAACADTSHQCFFQERDRFLVDRPAVFECLTADQFLDHARHFFDEQIYIHGGISNSTG
jgi:outer membrane receptor protein involved in Fe transport